MRNKAAAHQYQLHAHTLDDWGLTKLADQMREEMAEELGQIPHVRTDRIRTILDGRPPTADRFDPKIACAQACPT